MKNYLIELFDICEYPEQAKISLLADFDKITANSTAKTMLEKWIDKYDQTIDCDFIQMGQDAKEIAKLVDIHEFSAIFLAYACLTKRLKIVYNEKNMTEQNWLDCVLDLKWKLLECFNIKKIWGTSVGDWFGDWFAFKRFAFGRLQYEIIDLSFFVEDIKDFVLDGVLINGKTKVLSVHIPRDLTPLSQSKCDQSFEIASQFFTKRFGFENIIFACRSWMLYQPLVDALSDKSNTKKFVKRFYKLLDIEREKGHRPEVERVFDTEWTGSVDNLPENNFMQKTVKEHIKNGGKSGYGVGIFVYNNAMKGE